MEHHGIKMKGDLKTDNVKALDGTASMTIADSNGDVTFNNDIDFTAIKSGATKIEINTACDGSTAKNSHTHALTDGATDVIATASEVNAACDGIGVSIPKRKIVEIGDWDMLTSGTVNVAHGLTLSKIRGMDVTIRNDANTLYRILTYEGGAGVNYADSTNIQIGRDPAGIFASADYNATSYNRGWIIISYID